MSEEELKSLEREFLAWLTSKTHPVTHDELLAWAKRFDNVSAGSMRSMVWDLVDQDKVAFTRDWQLVAG